MTESLESTASDPKPDVPVRTRRRWPWFGSATLVLLLSVTVGVGWYFAGEVINVTHNPPEFPLTVTAASHTEVTLPVEEETVRDGTWGLQWDSGRAVLGEVVRSSDTSVVRRIDAVLYGS